MVHGRRLSTAAPHNASPRAPSASVNTRGFFDNHHARPTQRSADLNVSSPFVPSSALPGVPSPPSPPCPHCPDPRSHEMAAGPGGEAYDPPWVSLVSSVETILRPGDPSIWADVLEKIKANGVDTVSFYVNWALRTNNPNYTETWVPYMTATSKIIARNQITNGGSIILVQAENEFSAGTTQSSYMQTVIDTYRANGIVVPITHNDQHSGQAGNFSPDLPGTGRVNIYCGDSYPQGANSWAQVQSIYYSELQ
ncbi:glycoside hydrolase superfamily [Mycena albidolilacea]|uniref:Glycoside hydrolase superfamily n=1 Tax=Mycena albidolilacea TaxID=1033008 RepID=A0AAD7AB46_9AGAR|nr:glycoside hydrolase superfamily [Mycena albidolilacea]